MAKDPEHSEIIDTVVDVTMLGVVAWPDQKSSDAATGSDVEEAGEEHRKMEGVAEIPRERRKMKEVIEEPADRMKQEKLENMKTELPWFSRRNVDEIKSYCEKHRKSRNIRTLRTLKISKERRFKFSTGKGRMANDLEGDLEDSESIDSFADEEISDAGKGSCSVEEAEAISSRSVEEQEEENGKMERVIEKQAAWWKSAATHSPMKQEKLENREVVIQIPKGFNPRIVEEINVYCKKPVKSQVHTGTSGFYKVPEDMRRRQGRKGLYDPTHINFSKLRKMLENNHRNVETQGLLKHYYYHFFRIQEIFPPKKLADYLVMIYENRNEIASCYGKVEEDIDFPQLFGLFLSSCFVIYFLYYNSTYLYPTENKCKNFRRWFNDLWVDLLVLDNQIPFFVLKSVIREIFFDMERYIVEYFREFVPLNVFAFENDEPVHLLDFVHRSLLPAKQSAHRDSITNLPIFWCSFTKLSPYFCCPHTAFWRNQLRSQERRVGIVIPTATRLQQAGVQFRAIERKGFVVEFKRGVLRLPRLHIEKNTEKFFLNLIAWEQCHDPAVKYVINFAILMDHLINTSKDVEILIHNNVLENSLANEEEVATMFNSLGKDLTYTANEEYNIEYEFLIELSTELNEYCESRFNIWRAKLASEYFSSPWTILSLIAALLIILLTLVQAYFSAYSYFRPPK